MAKPIFLFDNRFSDGVPVASSTDEGYNVLHIRDYRVYTFWQAAAAGTNSIGVDCGVAKSADCLGIISHNLFTAGAQVSVESSTDNATWTTRLAAFMPSSNKAILRLFDAASARYWRVTIVNSGTIKPKIAVLMLGNRFVFERYLFGEFNPTPERIESRSGVGKRGYLFGRTIEHVRYEFRLSWQNLTDTWVRNTFMPAWDNHISLGKPVFFAVDIDRFPNDIYYLALADGFALNAPYNPVRRNLELEMVGYKEL